MAKEVLPPLKFDTDIDEITDPRFCEIPAVGPGNVNRLVLITGICNSGSPDEYGLDTFGSDKITRRVYILTNYSLRESDAFTDIVDGNQEPLHATYAALSGIAADDDTEPIVGVDEIRLKVGARGRVIIQLLVGMSGDVTLSRIGYQVNLLIHREVPPPSPALTLEPPILEVPALSGRFRP